jgi:hypothetical protein
MVSPFEQASHRLGRAKLHAGGAGVGAGAVLGTGPGGEGTTPPEDDPEGGLACSHGNVSTHFVPLQTYVGTDVDPSGQRAAIDGTASPSHCGLVVRPPLELELEEMTPELDDEDAPELDPLPGPPPGISTEPPHPAAGTPTTTALVKIRAMAWDRCMVAAIKARHVPASRPRKRADRAEKRPVTRGAGSLRRATLGRP